MWNWLRNIKGIGNSASLKQKNTPDIHIVFKQWIKSHPEYVTLVFIHGERLFMRDLDGAYCIQVTRLLFEVFEMGQKRGVTYIYFNRARKEKIKHALAGGVMGIFLTAILFKALGVF